MVSLYDQFLKQIKNCVAAVGRGILLKKRNLIVLAINEERIINKFLNLFDGIGDEELPTITFLCQPGMADVLRKKGRFGSNILEWRGPYTLQVEDYISESVSLASDDGFLYFCDNPINMRNKNILEIAGTLHRSSGMAAYAMDYDGDYYEYHQIDLLLKGLDLYADINDYIALAGEEKGE